MQQCEHLYDRKVLNLSGIVTNQPLLQKNDYIWESTYVAAEAYLISIYFIFESIDGFYNVLLAF